MNTLLLDFDYTLVDSSYGIVHCTQYAFMQMQLPVPSYEQVCLAIGHSLPDQYVSLSGDEDRANAKVFTDLFKEEQTRAMTQKTQWFDDALTFMDDASRMGLKMGIVSTKMSETIMEFLRQEARAHHFDVVIGEYEVSALKPDPHGIHLALAKLDARADETVMVGDSIFDAGAAQNAGVHFIPVLTGKTQKAVFSNYPCLTVADNLAQVLVHIQGVIEQRAL